MRTFRSQTPRTAELNLDKHSKTALPQEDTELAWDYDESEQQRSNRGAQAILWIVIGVLISAVVWASKAELDEVVVGAGRVIPSRQVQVVQNLEGGILDEIMVREGEVVEVGQILLRIDDTQFFASYREYELRHLALTAKAARLEAEAEGREAVLISEAFKDHPGLWQREERLFLTRKTELTNKLSIYQQQLLQRKQELTELRANIDKLTTGYRLANRELTLTKPLVRQGAVSEVEVIRLERQVNEIRGELVASELSLPRMESRLQEAKQKIDDIELGFRNQARQELNHTMAELAGLGATSITLEDRVERTAVRSPVRGTVKQLLVHTVGGVIQPGMDLIEIVPMEDTLLVEAQIRPANIAFLHPGQKAVVKFTAYDFSIYGGMTAKLEHVSADSIVDEDGESYYLVRVRTDRTDLGSDTERLPIIPGMTTYVDILTGKKTVLSYLLKPVLRAKERALRER